MIAIDWNMVMVLISLVMALIAIYSVETTNRTSRFCANLDLLIRLEERFMNKDMKDKRKKAVEAIKNKSYKDSNIAAILDFFSIIAIFAHENALDKKMIWRIFSPWLIPYYHALEDHIRQERERKKDSRLYESLSKLCGEILEFEDLEVRKEWEMEKINKLTEFYKEEIEECSF